MRIKNLSKIYIYKPEKKLIKGDGISFSPLEVDDDKKVKNDKKPYYLVENKPQIGKTTLYTLITNNGE